MIGTLSDAVAPTSMEQFLSAYRASQSLYIRGWADKFSGLLSWSDLGQILSHHQFDFPRMRLLQEGKIVPAESYLKYVPDRRQRGSFRTKLLVASFNELLKSGATLVIDDVQEMCPAILRLATSIEQRLCDPIHVNAYAAWASARALDLHWDDHDVLAMQVAGRKKWSVYAMTLPYPITAQSPPAPEAAEKAQWEGELESGDLLYIPRGWWHQVLPLAELTIHLTFGVYRQTGIDLLNWIAESLRSEKLFRENLPRFAGEEQQGQHLDQLRLKFLAQWDDQILKRFFRETDGMVEPASRVALPWSLFSKPTDLPEDMKLRLTTPRQIVTTFNSKDNTISFIANRRRWELPAQTATILQELGNLSSKSVRQLCEAVSGTITPEAVREFLLEVLKEGLIVPDDD